tara:strand:+ start:414 stop:596 length:183 start_codon:yes stop_codon:yes gene_type:complete
MIFIKKTCSLNPLYDAYVINTAIKLKKTIVMNIKNLALTSRAENFSPDFSHFKNGMKFLF